jgi:hypothetical protein
VDKVIDSIPNQKVIERHRLKKGNHGEHELCEYSGLQARSGSCGTGSRGRLRAHVAYLCKTLTFIKDILQVAEELKIEFLIRNLRNAKNFKGDVPPMH